MKNKKSFLVLLSTEISKGKHRHLAKILTQSVPHDVLRKVLPESGYYISNTKRGEKVKELPHASGIKNMLHTIGEKVGHEKLQEALGKDKYASKFAYKVKQIGFVPRERSSSATPPSGNRAGFVPQSMQGQVQKENQRKKIAAQWQADTVKSNRNHVSNNVPVTFQTQHAIYGRVQKKRNSLSELKQDHPDMSHIIDHYVNSYDHHEDAVPHSITIEKRDQGVLVVGHTAKGVPHGNIGVYASRNGLTAGEIHKHDNGKHVKSVPPEPI